MKNNKIPWIEKYRPNNIEDLVIDDNTRNKIEHILKTREMPNIIITGVPGIGKTTTIKCICEKLLGPYKKEGILELNASDDRGVKSVQDSIVHFCKKKMQLNNKDKQKYANHKIILLDEADNMTKKAQQSINVLIGKYLNTTRFAFTCNNSVDIIEAIQSRCIIFRYKRLDKDMVKQKLIDICKIENIKYTDQGINAIVLISQGDLRQAINNLQTSYNGYGKISSKNVYKLYDKPHPLVITNIFSSCLKKDIKDILIQVMNLMDKGYSGSDIILSMINTIKYCACNGMKEKERIEYTKELNKTCMIINKGIDTPLQIAGCMANLCNL